MKPPFLFQARLSAEFFLLPTLDTTCMSGKPLKAKRPSADGKGSSSGGGAAARGDPFSGGSAAAAAGDDVLYDESRLLPIANTSRIMKTALPPNAKISREGEFGFFFLAVLLRFGHCPCCSVNDLTIVCRSQRVRAKVCQRIHIVHHQRGLPKMRSRKAQDCQRQRLNLGAFHSWCVV